MKRRALSWLLAVAMLVSLLGIPVLAASTQNNNYLSIVTDGSTVTATAGANHTPGNNIVIYIYKASLTLTGLTAKTQSDVEASDFADDNGIAITYGTDLIRVSDAVAAAGTLTATVPNAMTGNLKVVAYSEDGTADADLLEDTIDLRTKAVVTLSANSAAYTGSNLLPTVTVKAGTTTLGTSDYTVAWTKGGTPVTEAVELGTYTATVTLQGTAATNYNGPDPVDFEVTAATVAASIPAASVTYSGEDQLPTVTVKAGNTTVANTNYTVAWTKGGTPVTEAIAAGAYTGTVTLTSGNYTFGTNSNTVTLTINKADPDGEVEFTFDEEKEDLTLADIDVDITGVVGVDGNELPGTFAFLDENGDPIAEADLADYPVTPETAYDYRFTPTDTDNYNVGENYIVFIGEAEEHTAYMQGTKAGTEFEPDRGMTRAEVAVMIANLDGYNKNVDYAAQLSKVPADLLTEKANLEKWIDNGYNKLCYILKEQIMQGRDDGLFHPYDTITRQEMAIVVGKYLGYQPSTGADQFNDLTGSAVYAEGKGYINALKAANKINGFPDGGYHPTENLTRAQAAKMMNYAMDREPDIAKMKAANVQTTFTDVQKFAGNSEAEWALYNIIEASKTHPVSDFH